MIDFLKLFKEATFLIAAGSLFQSEGAAAAKERVPSLGSILCVGGISGTLLIETGKGEGVGLRNAVRDGKTMFSQLAKRSPCVVVSG